MTQSTKDKYSNFTSRARRERIHTYYSVYVGAQWLGDRDNLDGNRHFCVPSHCQREISLQRWSFLVQRFLSVSASERLSLTIFTL